MEFTMAKFENDMVFVYHDFFANDIFFCFSLIISTP